MIEDDESRTSAVFTPKKSNLSRQAVEKNALRKSLASSNPPENLPYRQTNERPVYDSEYLNELKNSTPSTPNDLSSHSNAEESSGKTLDLAAKFGSNITFYHDDYIPTDAEIKEKKERRARLAKETEFINLSDEDDGSNEVSLLSKKHKPEKRLVRDDEDVAEGFDDFVEDGRIAIGRKAELEQKRKHETEIRDLINEAEGSSGDDTDDSEAERRAAYEVTQTRAGMDGLQKDDMTNGHPSRPKTPPRITPLPNLTTCLEKLKANLAGMQYARMQKVKRMEELQREKADIALREAEIQRLLKETGENYEKLRTEAGIPDTINPDEASGRMLEGGAPLRGLENFDPLWSRSR